MCVMEHEPSFCHFLSMLLIHLNDKYLAAFYCHRACASQLDSGNVLVMYPFSPLLLPITPFITYYPFLFYPLLSTPYFLPPFFTSSVSVGCLLA
jgi:hypothetical protein